ncbi:hypothetical protein SESBI_27680 [Sesbania bispinosa]|nr:hypothetical protein SESBI_27680 [Sesbania bispinosa]
MALTVTVNKYASSNLQAVHRTQANPSPTTPSSLSSSNNGELGRRGLVLSTVIATTQVPDSRTQLLKQRLDSYYKRNYKDYFELMEGSLKAKNGQLSDTEKGILDWLQSNK